jgi:hypothetical protein
MSNGHWRRCTALLGIGVSLGIVFGLIEAALWFGGLIPMIRAIIPYATADALLIFALTSIIAVILAISGSGRDERDESLLSQCFSDFVIVILIAATIFLLFVQVFLATVLPFSLKVIFAFIGAVSFWVMLTSFLAFIFSIVRRR